MIISGDTLIGRYVNVFDLDKNYIVPNVFKADDETGECEEYEVDNEGIVKIDENGSPILKKLIRRFRFQVDSIHLNFLRSHARTLAMDYNIISKLLEFPGYVSPPSGDPETIPIEPLT